MQIIRRMAGERAVSRETPGTARVWPEEIRRTARRLSRLDSGPGSSGELPFTMRPRPTGDASTRLVVTEHGIPRSGQRDLNILRGDRRFAWPHDILLDPKSSYAYYTDHFSLRRGANRPANRRGQGISLQHPAGHGPWKAASWRSDSCAPATPAVARTTSPSIPEGNVVIGMGGGTVRFNPRTETFTPWASGSNMFGIDPAGTV